MNQESTDQVRSDQPADLPRQEASQSPGPPHRLSLEDTDSEGCTTRMGRIEYPISDTRMML